MRLAEQRDDALRDTRQEHADQRHRRDRPGPPARVDGGVQTSPIRVAPLKPLPAAPYLPVIHIPVSAPPVAG